MFIPRGKAIHENLATSYVLVDALVDDLCEGGFSGIVEVVLRDKDGHVIIDRGKVAAVIEGRIDQGNSPTRTYSPTTLAEFAEQARRERGRLGIYSYPSNIVRTLARRAVAEPLYTRLSTDFANLEKMISKLGQEPDHEWFIEVSTAGGGPALLHIDKDLCQVIRANGNLSDIKAERLDPEVNTALRNLLSECSGAGGMIDVYFKRPDPAESSGLKSPAGPAHKTSAQGVAAGDEGIDDSVAAPGLLADELSLAGGEMSAAAVDPDSLIEAEMMIEIKRLMGEIARTIEEAIRVVEPRDPFAMYLRAGQLKIADRYPFLDPFGAEFEYLAGEIAFVGKASPAEFIAGLTEALKLALEGVAQSSTQPGRLRGQVAAHLIHLTRRLQSEFEQFGLDQSIDKIIKD